MKKQIIYLILMLFIVTGCTKNDSVSDISFSKLDDCNNKPQLLITKEDINIYTYCINDVILTVNNKKFGLKEYINSKEKPIEKITEILYVDDVIYDGGTKIFKGNNITLIRCNTLDGNKDIYIGDSNMKYKENFCKENNYTFIKTYTIQNIEKYTEQQYENGIPVTYAISYQVKLKDFEGNEHVVIINNIWDKLEKGKTYEFEFMFYDYLTDMKDDTQYIFKNSKIIEIRETNKTIDNQINEKIK